jgi:hypothetical protein
MKVRVAAQVLHLELKRSYLKSEPCGVERPVLPADKVTIFQYLFCYQYFTAEPFRLKDLGGKHPLNL